MAGLTNGFVYAATGATYTPNVIASNTVTWVIAPPASFTYAFNCTGLAVAGTFIADGTPNQTGTITIPINVVSAGLVTLNIAGTDFTGTLSVDKTAFGLKTSISQMQCFITDCTMQLD